MTIASSNFTVIRYGEYADPTTAAAPVILRELHMTGESLGYQTQSISSSNINSSRQVLDTIKTGYDVSGGLQIEVAPGIYDDLIEGALWADWGYAFEQTDMVISIDKATSTVTTALTMFDAATDQLTADTLKVGQFFQLSVGSTTPIHITNVGVYQIKSVTSGTVAICEEVDGATCFGETEATKTACLRACMIRAPRDGSSTYMKRHKYYFEKEQSDLTNIFTKFTECYVNTFSVSAQSAALLTGSFDFMGALSTIDATSQGSTLNTAHTFNGFNAVDHVVSVILNDKELMDETTGAYLQGVDFSVTNNLRGAKAIGHLGNVDTLAGQLGITGSLNVFFEGTDFYTLFVNDTEFSLSIRVENTNADDELEGYVYHFPRIVISSDSMSSGGNDQDLVESMQFSALYDYTLGTSIQIDRLYGDYSNFGITATTVT